MLAPILTTFLLVAQASAHASPPPSSASAEEARQVRVRSGLQAMMQQLNGAIERRDRAALERIYAPEFRYIHSSGFSEDREAQIRGILDRTAEFRGLPPLEFGPDVLLVASDDLALVRRLWRTPMGQEVWTSAVYARRNGAWQIVQMQGTEMNAARVAVAVPPERLQQLVGAYRQSNGNSATFSLEGAQLFVQFPNRPRWPLTSTAEDHFFDRSDNEYTFFRDAAGRVTHYVIRPRGGGAEIRGEPVR